jgi:hypothetical protein
VGKIINRNPGAEYERNVRIFDEWKKMEAVEKILF